MTGVTAVVGGGFMLTEEWQGICYVSGMQL